MELFDSEIESAKLDKINISNFVFCIAKDVKYKRKRYKGYKVYIIGLMPKGEIIFVSNPFYDNTK